MPTEKVISLNNLDRYDKNLKTVAGILQRSTAYVLGDVVHKKNIYLKCTTAGTTKATTLDLTNVAKGATVADGTVVWTVTSTTGPASGESSGAGLEDWQANHNYAVDDIYVYEGEIYKTLVKFTSGATEDSRTKVNDVVPSVWTANTEYTAGDIIEHTDVTTLKKVYYNVTSNFTSSATFEVTAEMQELQITEEYVPNPLTHTQVQNLINGFNPSGGGSSTSNNYSTEEQRIGTWIDGKPLYQKTYQTTTPSTINTYTKVVPFSDDTVDIKNMEGYFIQNNNPHHQMLNTADSSVFMQCFEVFDPNSFGIMMRTNASAWTNCTCYITIKYTKTTD